MSTVSRDPSSEQATPRVETLLIQAIDGVERFVGAARLAEQFASNRLLRTPQTRVQAMIAAESVASVGSGLVTNLGKLIIPVGIPDTRYIAWLIQIRLGAAIARTYGFDPGDPRVRNLVLLAVLGEPGRKVLNDEGVELPDQLHAHALPELPAPAQRALYLLAEALLTAPPTARETRSWRDQVANAANRLIEGIDPGLCYAVGSAAEALFRPASAKVEAAASEGPATAGAAPEAEVGARPEAAPRWGWQLGRGGPPQADAGEPDSEGPGPDTAATAEKPVKGGWPFRKQRDAKSSAEAGEAGVGAAAEAAEPEQPARKGWLFGKGGSAGEGKEKPSEASAEAAGDEKKARGGWSFRRERESGANADPAQAETTAKTMSQRLADAACALNQHKWTWQYAAEGSCDQTEVCANPTCSKTRGQRKDQHIMGEWLKDDSQCLEVQACVRCPTRIVRDVPHDWQWSYVADGSCDQTESCTHCGQTRARRTDQHVPGAWVRADHECKELQTCLRCGNTAARPIEHTWGLFLPPEGEPCQRVRICGHCGSRETGAPVHSFDDWGYESATSCQQVWICSGCRLERPGDIQHDWGSWAPTDEDRCVERRVCQHCGNVETRQLNHEWTQPYYKYGQDSTSCEQIIQCRRCGLEQDVDPRHAFSEWQPVGPNLCLETHTCSRCGLKEPREMEHLWSEWVPEARTCVQVCKCSRCKKVLRGEVMHRPGSWEPRSRTLCQWVRFCQDCGQVAEEGEEEHDFGDNWQPVPYRSCEQQLVCKVCGQIDPDTRYVHDYQWVYSGYWRSCEGRYECTKCSAVQDSDFKRQMRHDYQWVRQDDECVGREICQRCGETGETRELEHVWSPWIYVRDGSCAQTCSCTVCGVEHEELRTEHPPEVIVTEPWNDNPKITRKSCRNCKQQWFSHKELTTRGTVTTVDTSDYYQVQYLFKALASGRKLTYTDTSRSLTGLSVGDQVSLVLTYEDDKFHVQRVRKQG